MKNNSNSENVEKKDHYCFMRATQISNTTRYVCFQYVQSFEQLQSVCNLQHCKLNYQYVCLVIVIICIFIVMLSPDVFMIM